MTPELFADLRSQGFNHIPVTEEVLADLDTPLSSYIRAARGKYSYLLESANQGGEKWARYSMVGLPSSKVLKVFDETIVIEVDGKETERFHHHDPLEYIEQFQQQYRYPLIEDLPNYTGGLVGYFGYDTVRYVESKIRHSQPRDTIGTPDILLMVSEEMLVFDNLIMLLQGKYAATGGDRCYLGWSGEAELICHAVERSIRRKNNQLVGIDNQLPVTSDNDSCEVTS